MINFSNPHSQHVMQGQLRVSGDPKQTLTCILGSCISACMRDPELRLGGMNHFLLPGDDPRNGNSVRYGGRSMEELTNALLRKGAARHRLEVWLFGGANVLGGKTGVGEANCIFAYNFVRTEGFNLRGHDLGGTRGRRVRFSPYTGEAEVSLMKVAPVSNPVVAVPASPEIELF